MWRGTDVMGEMILRVPGVHNVYNALAAIAVGLELEVSFDKIVEGLSSSRARVDGFKRKAKLMACSSLTTTVITRPRSEPRSRRQTRFGGRRIVVLFQPHRYSRTHDLMQEFARSFNNADVLFITDIYAASEDPIEGVTAEALTAAIKRFGHKDANYIGALDKRRNVFARTRAAGRSRVDARRGHSQSRERPTARFVAGGKRQLATDLTDNKQAGNVTGHSKRLRDGWVCARNAGRVCRVDELCVWAARSIGSSRLTLKKQAAAIVYELDQAGIGWRPLGSGSNVLADDGDHHYVVLNLSNMKGEVRIDGELVSVSAGYSLPRLCIDVARSGLSGIEGLGGIPGTSRWRAVDECRRLRSRDRNGN